MNNEQSIEHQIYRHCTVANQEKEEEYLTCTTAFFFFWPKISSTTTSQPTIFVDTCVDTSFTRITSTVQYSTVLVLVLVQYSTVQGILSIRPYCTQAYSTSIRSVRSYTRTSIDRFFHPPLPPIDY
jgi:hypothetical protein